MARVIFRFSLDGDTSHVTGNAVRKNLEARGGTKIGTSAYELEDTLANVLDAVDSMTATLGAPASGGHLDHLWIYIDRTSPTEALSVP